jgi:hypothetical protein
MAVPWSFLMLSLVSLLEWTQLSLVSLLEWTQQIVRGLIWLGWLGLDIGVVVLVVGLGCLDFGLAALVVALGGLDPGPAALVVDLAVGLDDLAGCRCDP